VIDPCVELGMGVAWLTMVVLRFGCAIVARAELRRLA
jgi:hypothetical protein